MNHEEKIIWHEIVIRPLTNEIIGHKPVELLKAS